MDPVFRPLGSVDFDARERAKTELKTEGPIIHPAQCDARRSASVFASFSPAPFAFSRPAPRRLISKCICAHLCAHGRAGLKKRCVQAHCYFKELKIDCAIDQLKPGLKSGAMFFLCYLKSVLV